MIDRVEATPRIALLGPVLNYEETRGLVRGLNDRYPDIGLIVVREQRTDLEDWVDDLPLHAVLSPHAADATTEELLDRLSNWLISNGRAELEDFEADPEPEVGDLVAEMLAIQSTTESEIAEEVHEEASGEPVDEQPQEIEWEFPPLEDGVPSEAIAVVAPKGGQGKTTIAVNLATGLAEVAPNSVVLIDADLQFGDITAVLNLQPERTIVDAVADAAQDELVLKTVLVHHADGFFVVASAPSPELGDQVQSASLGRLIERLREFFRYVVVDTTPGLSEHTLVTIEHVTDAVFVSNMSVASLRALRTEFQMLTTLGLMPSNRHIVLNQVDKMSGLTVKDSEAVIGAPIDVAVPKSSAVLLASNRGIPLIHDDVRDPAARAVRSVVMRIAPEAFPKRTKIQRRRRSHGTE
ncbi:Flp pilus assembly CpaE family ATPase [Agromyces flavus]|uniref:Flp pilus assembly CpaE family ATPase n=1 Tax=Agromyces flavus TaxID=589382 RepID=A0ABT1KJT0_9MICO|nr:AAA family ATPase [Agromyces flavus]MCP2366494.1 Flp pilus assembly CpaE family ATPase [Agromyces flavus]